MRSFWNDQNGGVALMNGVAFLTVAFAVGGALDYTNATSRRADLQSATDAAVLSAASSPTAEDAERIDQAERVFLGSAFCELQKCETPQVTVVDGKVTINASADIKTSLLLIAGVDTIEIGAVSTASPVTENPVDVVMILDYSGSMNRSNKYQDMADAAEQFINSADGQSGDLISVGVVPFSKYVLTPMMGRYLFDVTTGNNLMGQTVVGCVLNREHPHSTNAEEPSTGIEASLWPVVSYAAAASASNASGYSDTYEGLVYREEYSNHSNSRGTFEYTLSWYDTNPSGSGSIGANVISIGNDDDEGPWRLRYDGANKYHLKATPLNGSPSAMFANNAPAPSEGAFPQYGDYAGSYGWTSGDDSGLPSGFGQDQLAEDLSGPCAEYATNDLWVRPLSQDFGPLKTAISQMRPIGLTNIALGLDLGWHMLTPEAPFIEASEEEKTKRVAILLTDGVQTVAAHGSGGSVSISDANVNIAESCAAMKADGIEIFTIAFDIRDATTRGLLKNCASSEPHYYEPSSGGDLDAVFEGIFEKVVSGNVRLTG